MNNMRTPTRIQLYTHIIFTQGIFVRLHYFQTFRFEE